MDDSFLEFFINGFVVGWSIAAVSVFAVAWIYMPKTFEEKLMKWMKEKKKKKKKKAKQNSVQGIRKPIISDRIQDSKIDIMDMYATRLGYSYLLRATDNFGEDNFIGLGKLGTLYKAAIGNGNFVVVKKFRNFHYIEQKFMSEIMINGRLRHRNLVSLLAFCIEKKERLLVYNYMANGSLYDWLHPIEMESKRTKLEWPLRLRITIGIARGLAWLHHNCGYRVTHGNICSKFILLDKNFDPYISNFGEGMVVESSSLSSKMRIYDKSEFKESDDVRAFGILLFEVATGEKTEVVANLCEGFGGTLSSVNFYDAIDRSLVGKGFDYEIFQFLSVALDCIRPPSDERPTMQKVYKTLSSIGAKNGSSCCIFQISKQNKGVAEHYGIEIVEESE